MYFLVDTASRHIILCMAVSCQQVQVAGILIFEHHQYRPIQIAHAFHTTHSTYQSVFSRAAAESQVTYPDRSEQHIRYSETGDQERRKDDDHEFHIAVKDWYQKF